MSQSPSPSCIDPRMSSFSSPMSPPASETNSSQNGDASNSQPNKKKRKSWGQVLPEPTTNLPPRKRAKTEAEKQQRLYERVQRNRQAAHNSRMRKQEEMDQTQAENNQLKQDKEHLLQEVARLQEELARYRGKQDTPTTDLEFSPPFCNVCPAVAVGNAEYFDGYGLGFSDIDSKTALNTDNVNFDNMDWPNFDLDFDVNTFLNFDDDPTDAKEQAMSWSSSYVPTVPSQAGIDTSIFPCDMNMPTLPGQSLF